MNLVKFVNGSYIEAAYAKEASRYRRANELLIVYEVSGDGGQSWTKQWLTPSDLTRHLCDGYLVRGV